MGLFCAPVDAPDDLNGEISLGKVPQRSVRKTITSCCTPFSAIQSKQDGSWSTASYKCRLDWLSEEQRRAPVSKLQSANTPSAPFLLEELCRGLGLNGLEKDMGILRNKLTHSASYGNFDFSKVICLQCKLSHVVDVCVLNILGYDGYYCYKSTAWRNVPCLFSRQPTSNLRRMRRHLPSAKTRVYSASRLPFPSMPSSSNGGKLRSSGSLLSSSSSSGS